MIGKFEDTQLRTSKGGQMGIGITTKDRWEDLDDTLSVLDSRGFSDLETIVIDDGSSHPAPASLRNRFPWVRFERSNQSLGLIAQRNRLAEMMTSDYYLSLDDDSFPAAGDFDKAVQFLEAKPDTVGLAFSIVHRDETLPGSVQTSCSRALLHRLWSPAEARAFSAPWRIRGQLDLR